MQNNRTDRDCRDTGIAKRCVQSRELGSGDEEGTYVVEGIS